jgi:hypothetical protein
MLKVIDMCKVKVKEKEEKKDELVNNEKKIIKKIMDD